MLEQLGLLGLFLGCFLSATVVPFASEALVTGATLLGYNVWVVVLVATLGNTCGGMVSYLLGWLCRWEWIERFLHVKRDKLMKVHERVKRWGTAAALLTWTPFVGDLIAIAMGLLRINPWATAALMFLGKFARYLVVAGVVNWIS
jgi:membrane protein YqaA with SNARE-associated domain